MAGEIAERYDVVDTSTRQLSNEQLQEKNNEEKDLQLDVQSSLGNVEFKTMRNAEVSLAEMEAFSKVVSSAVHDAILFDGDGGRDRYKTIGLQASKRNIPSTPSILYNNKDGIWGKHIVLEGGTRIRGERGNGVGVGVQTSLGKTSERIGTSTIVAQPHGDTYKENSAFSIQGEAGFVKEVPLGSTHALASMMATIGYDRVNVSGMKDCVLFKNRIDEKTMVGLKVTIMFKDRFLGLKMNSVNVFASVKTDIHALKNTKTRQDISLFNVGIMMGVSEDH